MQGKEWREGEGCAPLAFAERTFRCPKNQLSWEGPGYRVVRFWNNQVERELEGAARAIAVALDARQEISLKFSTALRATRAFRVGGRRVQFVFCLKQIRD